MQQLFGTVDLVPKYERRAVLSGLQKIMERNRYGLQICIFTESESTWGKWNWNVCVFRTWGVQLIWTMMIHFWDVFECGGVQMTIRTTLIGFCKVGLWARMAVVRDYSWCGAAKLHSKSCKCGSANNGIKQTTSGVSRPQYSAVENGCIGCPRRCHLQH